MGPRLRIGNPFRIRRWGSRIEEPELIEVAVTGAAGGVEAALGPDGSGAGGAEGLTQGDAGLDLSMVSISYVMSWASMRR
ncbi:hypothetical protein SBA6_1140004 [Candidatus Sulfopaludibacter sp. SbA6]|nr:hypothetical protein SBA6_1140004 [Candidatus Sulfopaludibacter sp. SbA6]